MRQDEAKSREARKKAEQRRRKKYGTVVVQFEIENVAEHESALIDEGYMSESGRGNRAALQDAIRRAHNDYVREVMGRVRLAEAEKLFKVNTGLLVREAPGHAEELAALKAEQRKDAKTTIRPGVLPGDREWQLENDDAE
jgi:hypothetical protein